MYKRNSPEPSATHTDDNASKKRQLDTDDICSVCLETFTEENPAVKRSCRCQNIHKECMEDCKRAGLMACPTCRHLSLQTEPAVEEDDSQMPSRTFAFDFGQDDNETVEFVGIYDDDQQPILPVPIQDLQQKQQNHQNQQKEPLIQIIKCSRNNVYKITINPDNIQPTDDIDKKGKDYGLVLDKSGSMDINCKYDILKKAVGMFISRLTMYDRVFIVLLDDTATRLTPLTVMNTEGKQATLDKVNDTRPGGGTNINAALDMTLKCFKERTFQIEDTTVLFFTDGQDDKASYQKAELFKQIGALLHPMGIGSDHDSLLLTRLAEIAGGIYSYIKDEDDCERVFEAILAAQTKASDAQVTILSVSEVYLNGIKMEGPIIELGTLFKGRPHEILVSNIDNPKVQLNFNLPGKLSIFVYISCQGHTNVNNIRLFFIGYM